MNKVAITLFTRLSQDGWQAKNVSVWIRQASGDGKMEKGTTFLSGTLDEWESKEKGKDSGWKGDQAKEDLPFSESLGAVSVESPFFKGID